MPEIYNGVREELTFPHLEDNSCVTQNDHYFPNIGKMVVQVFGDNDDVFEVD